MRDLFSEFGTVEIVTIPKDKETGSPRGFAFVDMSSPEELKQAVDGLDGREFGGRVLRVQESLPKAEAKKQAKKMGKQINRFLF